ncbi:MAG: serine--tRNA ligase [bacterium]|nr:serine--tRNA ligase [bacterium]
MPEIAMLRFDRESLRKALARRGSDINVDALWMLYQARRATRETAEAASAELEGLERRIPRLKGQAKQRAMAQAELRAQQYHSVLAKADEDDRSFKEWWNRVPSLAERAPKRWGMIPKDSDYEPKDHRELGAHLGMIDIERAAKVSGSRFGYLTGPAVMVEFALVRMVLELLGGKGFTPVVPPVLVREEALFGTGFFPDDDQQVYELPRDGLYLVGTSEVSLAAYHAGEVLDEDALPLRYAGFSTCFRREAGAHGKDTAGIFRVHQFDKVEMFSFCHPEHSWDEHEMLLAIEEQIVQSLEIPYRVVNVAAGDLGASAAKKYDIEAWIPSQGRYREITSCSNTTDFQSRRLRIRYRTDRGNRLVHTLNGTAVAVGRLLIALMENHQQADGSVVLPDSLRAYTGFDRIG